MSENEGYIIDSYAFKEGYLDQLTLVNLGEFERVSTQFEVEFNLDNRRSEACFFRVRDSYSNPQVPIDEEDVKLLEEDPEKSAQIAAKNLVEKYHDTVDVQETTTDYSTDELDDLI